MKIYACLIPLCMVIFACTSRQKGDETLTENTEYQIQVEEDYQVYELDDRSSSLAQILNVEFYTRDDAIVSDNTQKLYVFEDYHLIKPVGHQGSGPCEYTSATAYTIKNDTIYIADRAGAKIVAYDITTNECVREVTNRIITGTNSILKAGPDLYFTRGMLVSGLDPSTSFLYKIDPHGHVDSLDIGIGDLDALLFHAPVRVSAKMGFKKGKVFFYYPLSAKLFSYAPDAGSIHSFDIPLDLPENIDPAAIEGIMGMIEVVNKSEMIMDLYLLDRFIAIVTKQGSSPDISRQIKFVDYQGHFIGSIDAGNVVIDVTDSSFRTLKAEVDQPVDFPYRVIRRNYKID